MKRSAILLALLMIHSLPLNAQSVAAEEVVQKSIAYHGMASGYEQHHRLTLNGEYIVFEGEVVHDGLRLPETRRWYTNADGTYLGADVIEAYARLEPDGR